METEGTGSNAEASISLEISNEEEPFNVFFEDDKVPDKANISVTDLNDGNNEQDFMELDCTELQDEIPPKESSVFFVCPKCIFKTTDKQGLLRHLQLHLTKVSTFICYNCKDLFSSSMELQDHRFSCSSVVADSDDETEERSCPICNVIFVDDKALTCHKGVHDPSRTHVCKVCKYRFYTQESLSVHEKVHTTEVFKCPYCEYGNHLKKRMMDHLRTHTGSRIFKCKLCPYRGLSRGSLGAHMIAHSDARPYRCEICGCNYKTKGKLSAHLKYHSTAKPFTCSICQKSFKIPTQLKTHYRTHSEEKPYACDQCPHRTRTPGSLRLHANIHMDEKPYCCNKCDFRANQKSYLNWHQKMRH